MDVPVLIELYVNDVTRHLPRKQRADVGAELRALLREELSGKTPDEATAALRAFGRPSEVAARYHPMFAIVEPADTRAFLLAALGGAVVLALIAAPVIARGGKDFLNLLMLAWLGFLVIWFGIKSWAIRQWPASNQWRPRDRERANRFGTAALIAVILLGMVSYGAPQWVFSTLTHGGRLAPWLSYTDDFQFHRLPWLIGTWGLTALVLVAVLIEGRWRPWSRFATLVLNGAVIVILSWFRFGPAMFVTQEVDANVRGFLALAIGIVLIDTAVRVYNMRTDRADKVTA